MKKLIIICLVFVVSCISGQEGPLYAKKEQTIKVISKVGQIEIAITGKALNDGYEGDEIYVLNTRTEKVVKAKLVSPGKAEVVKSQ